MQRNEQEKVEDIVITFFQANGENKQIEVKQMRFIIPLNTGPFALAAMTHGFAEHFASNFDKDNIHTLMQNSMKDIEMFREIATKAVQSQVKEGGVDGVERSAETQLRAVETEP